MAVNEQWKSKVLVIKFSDEALLLNALIRREHFLLAPFFFIEYFILHTLVLLVSTTDKIKKYYRYR